MGNDFLILFPRAPRLPVVGSAHSIEWNIKSTYGFWRRDAHWCPQSMVVREAQRWRTIDFVGRVERFDAHLKAVLQLAGVTQRIDLPRMNEGPAAPFRYEEVLDEEIRDVGGRLFAADLRNFGYSL